MPMLYNVDLYDRGTANRCIPVPHITMVRSVNNKDSMFCGGTCYVTNQLSAPHGIVDGDWQGVEYKVLFTKEPFAQAVQRFEQALIAHRLWRATAKEGK